MTLKSYIGISINQSTTKALLNGANKTLSLHTHSPVYNQTVTKVSIEQIQGIDAKPVLGNERKIQGRRTVRLKHEEILKHLNGIKTSNGL